MGVDKRFERAVVGQLILFERRAARKSESGQPSSLASCCHRGHDELFAHVRRVARAVPEEFRAVAWLHHAPDEHVDLTELVSAGLGAAELRAVGLLAGVDTPCTRSLKHLRLRALAQAPGRSGYVARVVAWAALQDRLRHPPGVDGARL